MDVIAPKNFLCNSALFCSPANSIKTIYNTLYNIICSQQNPLRVLILKMYVIVMTNQSAQGRSSEDSVSIHSPSFHQIINIGQVAYPQKTQKGFLFKVFKNKSILFLSKHLLLYHCHHRLAFIEHSMCRALSYMQDNFCYSKADSLNFSTGWNLRDHLILHFHFAHVEIET